MHANQYFLRSYNIFDEVTQNPSYAWSKNPTQLAKLSFDEILDLTADIFINKEVT